MSSISGIAGTLDLSKVNQMSINLIKNRNTNGDKVLTADEAGNFGSVFSKIDVNGDDQVNKDELNAFYFSPARVDQMTIGLISSKDNNGDGTLGIDELGVSQEIFSKIDANSDGTLSKDELDAAHPLNRYNNAIETLKSYSSENSGSKVDISS